MQAQAKPSAEDMEARIKDMQEKMKARRESDMRRKSDAGPVRESPDFVKKERQSKLEEAEKKIKEEDEKEDRRRAKDKELREIKEKAKAQAKEREIKKKRDRFTKFKANIEKEFGEDEAERLAAEQRANLMRKEEAERKARGNAHKAHKEEMAKQERAVMIKRYAIFKEQWEQLKNAKSGSLTILDFTQWMDVENGNASFIDQKDDIEVRKNKIREATLRWHPDKFNATFGHLIRPSDEQQIKDLVQKVSQKLVEQRKAMLGAPPRKAK